MSFAPIGQMHRRPPRLSDFDYLGSCRYFVTCCTEGRCHVFVSRVVVDQMVVQILRSCQRWDFAVLAYVFMPDHIHLLVQGTTAASDFRAFMKNLRKRTSMTYKQFATPALWQDGLFERVLRDDETTLTVIDYLLMNPIRAGLVDQVDKYPFCWSITLE